MYIGVIDFPLTSMNEKNQILKINERGHVLTPRQQQEDIVNAIEKSGMTGAQFARHAGIEYPTFMSWVQRRRRSREVTASVKVLGSGAAWIEAVVENQPSEGLTIEIAQSLRVRIPGEGSRGMAVQLLQGLGYGWSC